MIKKEYVDSPNLGMMVYHDLIYNGNEKMEIVGIRLNEIELQGDFSGGTHNVIQKEWMPKNGVFRKRKVCIQHEKYGSCQLPNVHCIYTNCEPYI